MIVLSGSYSQEYSSRCALISLQAESTIVLLSCSSVGIEFPRSCRTEPPSSLLRRLQAARTAFRVPRESNLRNLEIHRTLNCDDACVFRLSSSWQVRVDTAL